MSDANFSSRANAMSSFLLGGNHYEQWCAGKRQGKEWVMINPTRGDKGYGSFSLNTETGVWKDFAANDSGADLVDLYRYVKGITLKDALEELESQYGRKDNLIEMSERRKPQTAPEPPSELWTIGTSECKSFIDREGRQPTFVAEYRNALGDIIGYVARYERPDKPGAKDYKPWTVFKGRWANSKIGWKATPIYGHHLLEGNDNPILIVEGEKCALAAQAILGDGWNVLTWPGGVSQASTPDWSVLAGNPKIYLWADDDLDPKSHGHGMRAMTEIRAAIGAGTIIDGHQTNKNGISGWDIADVIESGWTREQLVEFIETPHPPLTADPVPDISLNVSIPKEIEPICTWILRNANEKHELFAIQAAFCLLSALTMGAYQTPTSGSLGIYCLLVSGASGGKAAYVDKIMNVARNIAPFVLAGEPGSRQALRADMTLRKSNCLNIYNGELGVGLARVLVENGIGSQISQDLLDGWGASPFFPGLTTKEGKDADVIEPRISLYGGTTLTTFQELLGRKGAVSGGFISRLDPIVSLYINLDDDSDECSDAFPQVEMERLKRIACALTSQQRKISNSDTIDGLTAVRVSVAKTVAFSPEAHQLYKEYKKYCRARKKKYQITNQMLTDIYGRCYEKSLRYSSLLAIAANPDAPEITAEQFAFGRNWVEKFTATLVEMAFVHGNVSTHSRVKAAILRHLAKAPAGTATLRDIRRETLLRSEDVSVVKQVFASMVEDGLLEQKAVGKSLIFSLTREGRADSEI